MRRKSVVYVSGGQVLGYQFVCMFLATMLAGSLFINVQQYRRLQELEKVEPVYITTEQLALNTLVRELMAD